MTTYEAHRLVAWDEAEQPIEETESARESARVEGMFWLSLALGLGYGVLLSPYILWLWSALAELAGLVWGLVGGAL